MSVPLRTIAKVTNAATQLAALLAEWNTIPASQAVANVRQEQGEDDLSVTYWRRQIDAVRLLHDVDQQLDGMAARGKEVGHYRESFPAWAQAVFVPNMAWSVGEQSPRTVISSAELRILRSLGDILEELAPVWAQDSASVGSSRSAIDELVALITEGLPNLDSRSKSYGLYLTTSIRRLLDESAALGQADLARLISELRGFIETLADELEREQHPDLASKLRATVRRVYPWAVRTAVAGGFILDAAVNLKEITS